MKQYRFDDVQGMQELVTENFGPWSPEVEITQELINQFAEMTGDDYWLHTDPEKCKTESPFGRPIAHGFLILVLSPKMRTPETHEIVGYSNMLNYGSNKLRFTGSVLVGNKIHTRSRITAIEATKKGTQITVEQHIHVVGQDERPAVVYELMYVFM